MNCARCTHPQEEHEVLESRTCIHLYGDDEAHVDIAGLPPIPPELELYITDDFCLCTGFVQPQVFDRRKAKP